MSEELSRLSSNTEEETSKVYSYACQVVSNTLVKVREDSWNSDCVRLTKLLDVCARKV